MEWIPFDKIINNFWRNGSNEWDTIEIRTPHFNFPIQIIQQLTRKPELNLEVLVALRVWVGVSIYNTIYPITLAKNSRRFLYSV